jgi:hypothetical protein
MKIKVMVKVKVKAKVRVKVKVKVKVKMKVKVKVKIKVNCPLCTPRRNTRSAKAGVSKLVWQRAAPFSVCCFVQPRVDKITRGTF